MLFNRPEIVIERRVEEEEMCTTVFFYNYDDDYQFIIVIITFWIICVHVILTCDTEKNQSNSSFVSIVN